MAKKREWQKKGSSTVHAGDYEYNKAGKRMFHLNNAKGKAVAKYTSFQAAKKAGWKAY